MNDPQPRGWGIRQPRSSLRFRLEWTTPNLPIDWIPKERRQGFSDLSERVQRCFFAGRNDDPRRLIPGRNENPRLSTGDLSVRVLLDPELKDLDVAGTSTREV